MGHQLVYRTIGFDALMVLGYTPAANKGSLSLITFFGIDKRFFYLLGFLLISILSISPSSNLMIRWAYREMDSS